MCSFLVQTFLGCSVILDILQPGMCVHSNVFPAQGEELSPEGICCWGRGSGEALVESLGEILSLGLLCLPDYLGSSWLCCSLASGQGSVPLSLFSHP